MRSLGPERSRLRKRPSESASSDARHRVGVEVEQRELVLQVADLGVAEADVAARQPQLVEREPGLHLDREGARHDLQVELAPVAGADVVEAVVAVGDAPG